jgi:TldD protein
MTEGDRKFSGSYQLPKSDFSKLSGYEEKLKEKIVRAKDFMLNSEPVEAGKYTVVFAPVATAIFTHECFGHKSEADGMLGDEASKNEWVIGKKIAQDFLTIKDSGLIEGTGYVPYDDEGHPARENYLVKDGKLAGRLHNGRSAADFDEEVTGNARALDYTFEPIVRMTHTYIDKGDKTFEKLISEIETGVYVHDVLHGSGLTTFTIAPSVAYYIKNGKIDKPVRVSVVSGNVFEALANIDGISDEVEQFSSVTGGCGKFAQFPLPVGHGGPYIRVKNMTVQ